MKIINIFKSISEFFNKIIVIPISKLIYKISNKFDKNGKIFENFLSKNNTLLFISLAMAILIFVVIDQKIVTY